MKENTKIVVGIGTGVVVVVIATVVAVRLLFGGTAHTVTLPGGALADGTETVTEYALANFTKIEGSGAFQIAVSEAPAYQVQLRVPRRIQDYVAVAVEGDTLHIGLKPGVTITGLGIYRATITMPKLTAIHTSGAARVEFMGFSGDDLTIGSSGAASILGSGGSYRRLLVDSSGASVIGLTDLPVVEARIRSSGAGVVRLSMQGGELSGELTGAVRLFYSGSVKKADVQTSGAAVVTKR